MGEITHQSSVKRGKAGRFVVLALFDGAGPEKLLAGLRSRNAAVRMVSDTAQAMVEIAHFKAQVLIVHEPETICDIESLLSAVRLYHPAVICWRHQAATPGKRENLSPFACQLTPVSAPRFTPAPQAMLNSSQQGTSNGRHAGRGSTSTDSHASPQSQPKNKVSEPSRKQVADIHSNGRAQSPEAAKEHSSPVSSADNAAGSSSDHSSPAANGHRDHGNLHNNNPFHVKPFEDDHTSLGHRLSRPLDALDDLTAGPLLSAEEIELLRGPMDNSDYPEEGYFSSPDK